MLTGVTRPAQHSASALRLLLDLLAQGAAAEEFDRPAAAAREAGASAAELAEIAEAAAVALRIRRTLGQHRVREAQLTALFDTASDLAALRDLDAVLRAIVHRAKLLLGTDVTYLSLNDDAAGDTYMRVTDGSVAEAFQRVRLGMGEGLGGLVAQTARPYATGDYQADTRFHHTTTIDSAVLDEGLRAILGVPLRLGARIIGVLYAADRSPREFTATEVALLSSLADHAAIAIDGARLLEETRAALVDLNAASETIRTHSEAMRRAEEAHDQLTDLVLRGGGAGDVAAALADILDGGILIHDADGAELARARTEPLPQPIPAVSASRAQGPGGAAGRHLGLRGPRRARAPRLHRPDRPGRARGRRPAAVRAGQCRHRAADAAAPLGRRDGGPGTGELLGDLLARTGDPGHPRGARPPPRRQSEPSAQRVRRAQRGGATGCWPRPPAARRPSTVLPGSTTTTWSWSRRRTRRGRPRRRSPPSWARRSASP